MGWGQSRPGTAPVILVLATLAIAVLGACGGGGGGGGGDPTDLVARGDELYHGEATCQTCHGADLQGTSMGPPFLDEIYEPGHHPDAAFFTAVENGVQPHHWEFGPMPSLPHLDDDDIEAIVAYIRQEQRQAGIGQGQ